MANKNPTSFLSLALLLLSLAAIHVAESRTLLQTQEKGVAQPHHLICEETYGAAAGDTCFSITTAFNLTTQVFSSINPNLNCDKIFIGEWLCVDGFTV